MYDCPVLVLDPGVHTAAIRRLDADREGRFLVTASDDKTVRVWTAEDGKVARTIRLPAGPDNVGKAFAVAISPDGALIAAGGWTRASLSDPEEQVYLFDCASGRLLRRVGGLPASVFHLVFSPDGSRLAATLAGRGVRLIDPAVGRVVAADEAYGAPSYGAAFDPASGRLATASFDSKIRLYERDSLRLLQVAEAPGGRWPFGIAFSPDGMLLAVGYHETTAVEVLNGTTLARLFTADTAGVDNGDLSKVAWSANGETLFAAGIWCRAGHEVLLRCWPKGGRGAPADRPLSLNNIMGLRPLPDERLAFAAADPRLGVLDPDGQQAWCAGPSMADFRGGILLVSIDGGRIVFPDQRWDEGKRGWDRQPIRFSLPELQLAQIKAPEELAGLVKTRTAAPGLEVENWEGSTKPTLNGVPLALEPYEPARCLAIAPDWWRFVLGTDWSLRLFDRNGTALWRRPAPGMVCMVNVSGDGRLVVAAYGDGTIRWHKLEDGTELLAFLPLADRTNWVIWTPGGLYAATPGARGVLRWHVNHGWDQVAEAIPVHQIREQHRPDVLPLVLQEMNEVRALGLAESKKIREAVHRRTGGDPAGKLHLLAIGVSEYKEEHAQHLHLRFAHADARDVASALIDSQKSLYADVIVQTLRNNDATQLNILRGLETIKGEMKKAPGRDFAVVQFSGHGAVVDEELYLLPHEVDPRTTVELKATALSFALLRRELLGIAQYGRVLVLLDACQSGTATMDGATVTLDAAAARAALVAPNVTVLTSTARADPSFENERWANGALTEAFLEALRSYADRDHDGLLSVGDIEWYVAQRLPEMTGGCQCLGVEKRFDGSIFVAGL